MIEVFTNKTINEMVRYNKNFDEVIRPCVSVSFNAANIKYLTVLFLHSLKSEEVYSQLRESVYN